jgi:hypothetical protein
VLGVFLALISVIGLIAAVLLDRHGDDLVAHMLGAGVVGGVGCFVIRRWSFWQKMAKAKQTSGQHDHMA